MDSNQNNPTFSGELANLVGDSDNPYAAPQSIVPHEADSPELERTGPPWEEETSLGSFFRTVQMVLVEPSYMFATMRLTGGLGKPFAFAIALSLLLVALLIALVIAFLLFTSSREGLERLEVGLTLGPIVTLSLLFILIGVALLTGALVVNLVLKLFGKRRHGYEANFRILCYVFGSMGYMLLIPFVNCVALVWGIYLASIGISRVQRITTGYALIIALLSLAISIALFVLGLLAMVVVVDFC
ncbi:MAG: YIP1 family protein [Planctomycetota bacterium]|nr:YIP1 family protein [Planctomycetota bacterium]